MVIWKQTLQLIGLPQTVLIPTGAVILSVREQHEEVAIWHTCDPDAPKEERTFGLVPTGGVVPGSESGTWEWKYLGTCSFDGGNLILHVFESMTKQYPSH